MCPERATILMTDGEGNVSRFVNQVDVTEWSFAKFQSAEVGRTLVGPKQATGHSTKETGTHQLRGRDCSTCVSFVSHLMS